MKKKLKKGKEHLANLFKKHKGKLTEQSKGHYREMEWLPFQKNWMSPLSRGMV